MKQEAQSEEPADGEELNQRPGTSEDSSFEYSVGKCTGPRQEPQS